MTNLNSIWYEFKRSNNYQRMIALGLEECELLLSDKYIEAGIEKTEIINLCNSEDTTIIFYINSDYFLKGNKFSVYLDIKVRFEVTGEGKKGIEGNTFEIKYIDYNNIKKIKFRNCNIYLDNYSVIGNYDIQNCICYSVNSDTYYVVENLKYNYPNNIYVFTNLFIAVDILTYSIIEAIDIYEKYFIYIKDYIDNSMRETAKFSINISLYDMTNKDILNLVNDLIYDLEDKTLECKFIELHFFTNRNLDRKLKYYDTIEKLSNYISVGWDI